jgi:hypothetical protein
MLSIELTAPAGRGALVSVFGRSYEGPHQAAVGMAEHLLEVCRDVGSGRGGTSAAAPFDPAHLDATVWCEIEQRLRRFDLPDHTALAAGMRLRLAEAVQARRKAAGAGDGGGTAARAIRAQRHPAAQPRPRRPDAGEAAGACPVRLQGKGEPVILLGTIKKRALGGEGYDGVAALVQAYPDGLSRAQLGAGPVRRINELRGQDPDWRAVLQTPSCRGGPQSRGLLYRLVWPPVPVTTGTPPNATKRHQNATIAGEEP